MTDLLSPPDPAVPRVRALVYETATGRILFELSNVALDMVEVQAGEGQATLVTDAGDGGARWFVQGGALALRPTLGFDRYVIAADGEDTATLALPGRFTVRIDDALYAAEDRLEITADMPARYRIVIEDRFPFLDLDVEIVAS